MPSHAKYIISAIILTTTMSYADIDFYGSANVSTNKMGFEYNEQLIPGSLTNQYHWTLQELATEFNQINAELSGKWNYADQMGFYGSIIYGISFSDSEKNFAMQSFKLEHQGSPSITLGGYLETQSQSEIQVGAQISAPGLKLSGLSDGLLYNGAILADASEIRPISLSIMGRMYVPVVEWLDAYLHLDYGLTSFNLELDGTITSTNANCKDTALVAQPTNRTLNLGRQLTSSPKFLTSNFSVGFRTHIYKHS